ncbi:hypothetical protein QYF36_015924 [Acer negundo]|nr:hypothetical protein QYF36_015924 [Acer negundo]
MMDPMFMKASLFVAFDPLEVPRSRPSSQVGPIEALSGSISVCTWVDPLMGTCSHSDKGNSVMPSHVNDPSFAKEDVAVPHSLVSNALVVSSDSIASAIFSDSVSLTVSREQQPESVNAIPIVPRSSTIVPVLNYFSVNIRSDLSLDFSVG